MQTWNSWQYVLYFYGFSLGANDPESMVGVLVVGSVKDREESSDTLPYLA